MCGITGFLHFEKQRIADSVVLKNMTDSIAHRGPDGEGFYCHQNVGLGHRRLSIIDLDTGSQPMFSDDRSIVIVFNGEIYNYIELRQELKMAGHRFHTDSDTEVIIKAYQQWGVQCQNKFNGMWAFALWDEKEQQLFLSIDRVGEKPLYYTTFDNTFVFGSEIKALLKFNVPAIINQELIEIYLTLGYIPAPYSFYKNIHKLLPGHHLIVKDSTHQLAKYWDFTQRPDQEMIKDKKKVYQTFEELFYDSVKIRMRSDVPYGAFLSGGLDSGSVVSAMSSISSYPVKTFTIGFEQKEYDETELAKEIAHKFNTQHHVEMVELTTFDESLKKILYHYDEPFGDSSAIPTGYVAKTAARSVKMVLTGDGGDEVLSGYTTYQGEKFASMYKPIPFVLRKGLLNSVYAFAFLTKGTWRYKLNRVASVLNASSLTFLDRLLLKVSWVSPHLIHQLIGNNKSILSFREYIADFFKPCTYKNDFYKMMYFHLKCSLPYDMLVKVDRMTMAYSLEARAPFLDYRLIDFMTQVDHTVKMKGFERKSVLRNTIAKQLPHSVLNAPKKGFGVPLREWFKYQSFDDKLRDLYEINFGLNSHVIKGIIEENKQGKYDLGNFIWMLFLLKTANK